MRIQPHPTQRWPLRVSKPGVNGCFALASGFLPGKYRDEADLGSSPRGSGVRKDLNQRGRAVLSVLDEVALARLMACPDISAPITNATRLVAT